MLCICKKSTMPSGQSHCTLSHQWYSVQCTTRTNVFKYCAICSYCEHVEKYHAQRPVTLHLSRISADNTQTCKSIQVLCMLWICKKVPCPAPSYTAPCHTSDTTRTNVFKYFAICAYCEHVEKYHAQRPVTLHQSHTSNNKQKSFRVLEYCTYRKHVENYHAHPEPSHTVSIVTPVIIHTSLRVFKYCAICAYCEHVEKYYAQRPVTLHQSHTRNNTQKCQW